MPDRTTPPNVLSPSAPTVQAEPKATTGGSDLSGSATQAPAVGVALVTGSGPELTGETRNLLQSRLKTAAGGLCFGFAVFLVRHFLLVDFSSPVDVFLFGFHIAATIVLGSCGILLYRYRALSLRWLRVSEFVIFGLPTVFFVLLQYFITLGSCLEGVLDFPEGLWLVLIYTYAMFIPNTARRAAAVIGLLAVTPMTLLIGMMWWYPVMAAHTTTDQLTGLLLMFVMAWGGSVLGVGIIGALRREAFEARQLGQYRLTRRIGAGGMGEVYLAEHQLLKRPCVVKLIQPDKAGDPKNLARFQREVRATAKLSHWNTVEIFDYGCTAEGTFYYVMEYLPGMSLGEIVERFGPMPPERVIYLLGQACDALSEAHAAGLIHRDIKPANIFAAQRGGVYDVAKLLDFGLVKPLVDDQPIQLTVEGVIAGSPLFMSPEQALGDAQPDARSDIYSLGAVGYYLLTGRPPFQGDKPMKVLLAHAHDAVVPPSQYRAEIPADLERVILRCLAKSPTVRFPSAASLREALAGCEAAGGWDRERAAQWWQRRELKTAVA
jgi:eukaryotic-like serine/threonine-protein kinase